MSRHTRNPFSRFFKPRSSSSSSPDVSSVGPVVGPTPYSSLLPTPHTPTFTPASPGLRKLHEHSMPNIFYDPFARYSLPKCYPGTREEYIAKITDWALGNSDHNEPILWMYGSFGIGKSAVAQTCAEVFQTQNKLAASIFFSRSTKDRDDPQRLFTSIALEISTAYEPYASVVDAHVRDDPTLVTKPLSVQFEELLVYPLSQVDIVDSGIEGRVVVIDGLDECRSTSEQCNIINIIATSVRNRTTPFRWFITSSPEDHITQTMNSDTVCPFSFHLKLPLSDEKDILIYLTSEFKQIGESYNLADSWSSKEDIALLVEFVAGVWVCASFIIGFITDEDLYGPEGQLRKLLQLVKYSNAKAESNNPFMEMTSCDNSHQE